MKLVHYKLNDKLDILLYDFQDKEMPEDVELIHMKKIAEVDHIDVEPYIDYPVFEFSQFMQATLPMRGKRTRDAKLSEAGVETMRELANNYLLVRYGKSPLSRSLRDLAVEKYIELSPFLSPVAE